MSDPTLEESAALTRRLLTNAVEYVDAHEGDLEGSGDPDVEALLRFARSYRQRAYALRRELDQAARLSGVQQRSRLQSVASKIERFVEKTHPRIEELEERLGEAPATVEEF